MVQDAHGHGECWSSVCRVCREGGLGHGATAAMGYRGEMWLNMVGGVSSEFCRSIAAKLRPRSGRSAQHCAFRAPIAMAFRSVMVNVPIDQELLCLAIDNNNLRDIPVGLRFTTRFSPPTSVLKQAARRRRMNDTQYILDTMDLAKYSPGRLAQIRKVFGQ